jgi:hypothetical protein
MRFQRIQGSPPQGVMRLKGRELLFGEASCAHDHREAHKKSVTFVTVSREVLAEVRTVQRVRHWRRTSLGAPSPSLNPAVRFAVR